MINRRKQLLFSVLTWLTLPVVVLAQSPNTLTALEKKDGWALLFDGNRTTGWTTPDGKPVGAGWVVENGTLTARKGAKGGDIVSVGEYANFELALDYNLEPTGNSGVKYFYTRYETGGNLGMEYQLLDDQLAEDNKKANHLTGSFYDVIPPDTAQKRVNPPGQWNSIRIVANGRQVQHWLNGVKILEFTRGSAPFTEAVANSKFSKAVSTFGTVERGRILLQEHGHEVSFRNIKIKPL